MSQVSFRSGLIHSWKAMLRPRFWVATWSFPWRCSPAHLGKRWVSDFQSWALGVTVYTSAAPGIQRCSTCSTAGCGPQGWAPQGRTGKEARHVFIYSNNLSFKPEVGTHPRESLNDFPAAKSFFYFVVFPNPHVLLTGKQGP